ncbi:ATP-binding protein [Streptomyces rubradiris]|uniref:ATP-binding protein n=1 Tax=Streptomyces rubradiris TaxID=285531 RepID=A0ABQ3RNY5_STRRR|nr:ATP-binding protein [Streptomyces rubradiris]GHH12552.1 ATP-binding protein [Streptomyces rubradiris]GHI57560.1 ATP-binding protein [Streptomyces rubradiris]
MTSLSKPVQTPPAGHPVYSQTLPCETRTAGHGRRLIRDALGSWHLDDLADSAELIITELVANAARHTPCRSIRLLVRRPSEARVHIGVVDRAPSRLPVFSPTGADDERGRGLVLIDALAERWGYTLLGSHPQRGFWGKEIWAELKAAL